MGASSTDPFAPRTAAAKFAQHSLEKLFPDRNFKTPSSIHGLDFLETRNCGTKGVRIFYLSGKGLNSYPKPIYCGHCCRCLFEKWLEILWQLAQIVRDLPPWVVCIYGQLFNLSTFSVREQISHNAGDYYGFRLTAGHPVGQLRERQVERLKYLRKKGEDLGACSIPAGTMHSLAVATPGSAEAAELKARADRRAQFLANLGLSDSCPLEPDLGPDRCDGVLFRDFNGNWAADHFEPLLLVLSENPPKASSRGPAPIVSFVVDNPAKLVPYVGALLDASRELVHNEGAGKAVRVSWCGRWNLTKPDDQKEEDEPALEDLGSVRLDYVSLGAWPWCELSTKLENSPFMAKLKQLTEAARATMTEDHDGRALRRYIRLWEVYFGFKAAASMHRQKEVLCNSEEGQTRAHHRDQAEIIDDAASKLLWKDISSEAEILCAQGAMVNDWMRILLESARGSLAA